jgi:four helix bundle protein
MKYSNFEELPVWQDAISLTAKVFHLTDDTSFRNKGDIANQLQRAALSVSNNIAEGFERGTTSELVTFVYYAKGSAGEVRSICHVLDRLPYFNHLKSEISDLKLIVTGISRQLNGWAASLQNTEITGHRHLTDKTRKSFASKKQASAFMDRLKADNVKRMEDLQRTREAAKVAGA